MKTRAICKRCHRIRVVDQAGYCEACDKALRAAERPRVRAAPFASTPNQVTISGEAHSTSDPLVLSEGIDRGSFAQYADDDEETP